MSERFSDEVLDAAFQAAYAHVIVQADPWRLSPQAREAMRAVLEEAAYRTCPSVQGTVTLSDTVQVGAIVGRVQVGMMREPR